MREQLIRYLLGELDEDERRDVRALLRDNPDLQRELAQLRECFASNQEFDDEPLPPRNLAKRTAMQVADSDDDVLEAISSTNRRMESVGDPPAGVLGWSLADLTVAGGVMLAVSMLLFPALRDSRDGSRQTACADHLRQLYVISANYAQNHYNFYPRIQPNESAGIVMRRFVEEGYVEPDVLAVLLVCPSSPLAAEIRAGRAAMHVPTREEIRDMKLDDLLVVTASLSPCYGIRMPQKVGDDYVELRTDSPRQGRFNPLFGDLSGDPANSMSSHHRGSVIQFINLDGSLLSMVATSPSVVIDDVDPFRNDLGMMAAGIGPRDLVLAPGNAKPGLEFAGPEK